MPRKPRAPPLQTASSKPLTSAERNAKWRLAHDRACSTSNLSAPLPGCIPRGNIDLDQLETAATATLALYDKLVRNVNRWLDRLDTEGLSTGEGLVAFRLLPQVLESLAVLRAKISEQRAAEARDVTAQMQQNLEPPRRVRRRGSRKPSNCCAEDSTTTLSRRQTKPGFTVTSHFGRRIS